MIGKTLITVREQGPLEQGLRRNRKGAIRKFPFVREQGPVEQGFAIREKHIAFGENSYLYAINWPKTLNVSN